MEILYQVEKKVDQTSLAELCNDAGWTAYTNNPKELGEAIENSLFVLSARDQDKLVGLLRVVGDGKTIIYIQDILVLRSYRRKGIGTELMQRTLEQFKDVRQKVLLTEDDDATRGFYESLGFESCDKGELVAFVKLENRK